MVFVMSDGLFAALEARLTEMETHLHTMENKPASKAPVASASYGFSFTSGSLLVFCQYISCSLQTLCF